MPNKYLSYDEERAPKVREMFSRLAWRYDLVNDVMSFGHAPRVEAADGPPRAPGSAPAPRRWLDLCCGTGDMAFLAEQFAGRMASGRVGLRLHPSHARRGRARASAADGRRTRLRRRATRSRLPFPDGAFDVITVGYGLRNIADPARRPGRRCAASSPRAAAA